MRASIRQIHRREVRLSYTTLNGDRISRTFWVPDTTSGHTYVRERVDPQYARSQTDPQVCDGLYSNGSTLTATPETLLAVIRREWRVFKRKEKGYTL
jgi:hypothetical protein